jgi:tape measure domain-containing protein
MQGIKVTIETKQAIANITALREGLAALEKTAHASVKKISDVSEDFNTLSSSTGNLSSSLADVGASLGGNQSLTAAGRSVQNFGMSFIESRKSIELFQDGLGNARGAMQDVQKDMARIGDARSLGFLDKLRSINVTGLVSSLEKVVVAVVDMANAGVKLDAFNRTMTYAAGGADMARATMAYLREEAGRLAQNVYASMDAYKGFSAAAKGTALEGDGVRKMYSSMSEAAAVLSLSQQQVELSLRALGQMMSKGNVQAEELRGQLGENLPGAFNLAARAMGVTQQQLNKMLEQGEVAATDLLPRLAEVMHEEFGAAAEAAARDADNITAAMNRAGNSWENFKTKLVNNRLVAGTLNWVSEGLDDDASMIEAWGNRFKLVWREIKGESLINWDVLWMGREEFNKYVADLDTIPGLMTRIESAQAELNARKLDPFVESWQIGRLEDLIAKLQEALKLKALQERTGTAAPIQAPPAYQIPQLQPGVAVQPKVVTSASQAEEMAQRMLMETEESTRQAIKVWQGYYGELQEIDKVTWDDSHKKRIAQEAALQRAWKGQYEAQQKEAEQLAKAGEKSQREQDAMAKAEASADMEMAKAREDQLAQDLLRIEAKAEAMRKAGQDEVKVAEYTAVATTAAYGREGERRETLVKDLVEENAEAVRDWSEKAAEWELASADEATREKARLDAWYLDQKQAIEQDERLGAADKARYLEALDQARIAKGLKITRNAAAERADIERQAAEELADLLPETDERVWKLRLDQEQEGYREKLLLALQYGGDVEDLEEAHAIRLRQLAEEEARAKILASDDWVAAIILAHKDIEAATESWGKRFYDLTKETYGAAADVMGDMFFDALKGQLKDLGDYVEAFLDTLLRSVTQTMAQVAIEFATSSLVKLGGGFLTSVIGELPFWHEGKYGPLSEEEALSVVKKNELIIPEKQSSAIMEAMGSDGGGTMSKESFFDSIVGRLQGSASPWDIGNVDNPVSLGKDLSLALMRASVPTAMGVANYVQSQSVIESLIASGALPESLRDQAMGLAAQNALTGAVSGIVHGVITGFMGDVISRSFGVTEYGLPSTIVSAGLGMLFGGPLAMGANLLSPFVGLGISGFMDAMGLRGNESTRDMLENLYGELGGRRMYEAAHNSLAESIDNRGIFDTVLDSLKSSATMGIMDTDPARFYDAPVLGIGPWGSLQLQSLNYGTGEVVSQDIGPDFVGLTTNPDGSVLVGGQSWNIANAFTPDGMIEDINSFNQQLQDFSDEYDLGMNIGNMAADAQRIGNFNSWIGAILGINADPRAQAAASATGVLSFEPSNVLTMNKFDHDHYNVGTGRVEVGNADDPTRDDDTSSGPDVGGNPQGGYSGGGRVDRLFQIPGMSPPAGDDGFAGLAYGEVVLTREQAARMRAMGALPGYAKGSGSDRGDPTYVLGDDTLPDWAKHFSDLDRALEALTEGGIHLTQEGLRALMDQVDDNASSYKEYVKALKEGTDLTDKEKTDNELGQREAQALADITGQYEGLNDILMEQAKLAADTAKYEEIKAAEEAGWTKDQLKRLEEVQHLEDEAGKAQIDGDLELRRLRLEGHDLEASRLEQERSKQEALAQAIADGYSADQVADLADMIDAEFAKGLADAAASFAADMNSRELTASGQTGEAERQGRARDQADELEAAVSQFGEGSAEVSRLLAVQAAENNALAESMAKSIDLNIAQVTGNEEGAAWMQLQTEHATRWQEAIAAGVSDDVLARLEEAMELENQQFEQERQHAAEIAALETKERTESLQVRMLRAQGLDDEADALALQMEQERELLEARQAGYTEAELALLLQVQAAEKLQAAAEGVDDAVTSATQAASTFEEEYARLARLRAGADSGQPADAYDYQSEVMSKQRSRLAGYESAVTALQARIDAVTSGKSTENLQALQDGMAGLLVQRDREAQMLADMGVVYDAMLAEREGMFTDLDIRELAARGEDDAAEYAQLLKDMQDEMDEAALKFDDEYTARLREVQALELLQWAQDKQAEAVADLTDAYRDAADDLADTIRDLTYSEDLSTLDPGEKLAKLQAEFDALSAKALAGDAEAMAQLGGLSQEYLSARREYYGSSGGYASEYERVMGILSTAQTMAETYAKTPLTSEVYEKMSEAQLDELRAMSGYMETIASQDQLSQWQQLLQAMGVPGYASGGLVTSVARIPWLTPVGDDGVIGARIGEQMLTPDQLANLSPARILDLSAPIGSAKGTVGGDASKQVVAAVNKLTAQFTSYRQQQADEQKEIRAQNTALIRENKELRLKAQRSAAR